jgi:sulfide:quinone oxidoreductase
VLVTPESAPLERFETAVSSAVAALLDDAGIEVHCGSYAAELSEDGLRLVPEQQLDVERVVALPRLRGPYIAGLRCNHDGFLRADRHGLVLGVDDVYAIGDATSFPLKHGGIAVQQAGAAAESVAARLGLSLRPAPFRPVLRGLLLSGETPRFVWADSDGADETSTVAYQPLWWPPSGRLAGYLGSRGLPVPEPPTEPSRLPVELTLAPCETAAKLEPAGV